MDFTSSKPRLRRVIIVLALILCGANSIAAPYVAQPPERLVYTFAWSPFFKVGRAEVTLQERPADQTAAPQSREIVVSVAGRTNAFIDALWRYRLTAFGVVPLQPLEPGLIDILESEKRKVKRTRTTYRDGEFLTVRNKQGAVSETRIDAPNGHGMLSTLYDLLSRDMAIGDRYKFETIAGRSRYEVVFDVLKHDRIKLEGQKIDAVKLRVSGRDLTDPGDTAKHRITNVWVSRERPRRLLQAVSRLWIGTVKVRLQTIEPLDDEAPRVATAGD
ncbi:MAG: DUF3108 domain-containing protein [Gammaproteobacteria bacterium]